MAIERANDLRAFRDFASEQLADGGADMTLGEALSLWEYENSPEEEREETLRAIRRGLDDMDAGRTKPAEEALRDLCRKHGIPEPR
jgi:predicted transcriptional regulator